MCTFKDEQTVQVCDVAISRVRERLQEVFGDTVQYTTVNGQGTLVQAPSTVDSAQFQSVTREAIAQAQNTVPTPSSPQDDHGGATPPSIKKRSRSMLLDLWHTQGLCVRKGKRKE